MISAIWRVWRMLATGFCFAFFGLGGLFLALLVFPTIALFSRDQVTRRKRVQAAISRSFRFFIGVMRAFGVMTFSAEDIDKLTTDKGTIVVANHPSLIDVILLGAVMPRFDCIVKQALWHNPLLKGVVNAAGFIPNSAGEEVINTCRERLEEGENLVIFPEGTRTVPGQKIKLQRGAAQIAVRTQAPVRLVNIVCSPTTLTKGEKWYDVPPLRPHFRLKVGELVESKGFCGDSVAFSLAARRLNSRLTEALDREIA
ncbi:lysophospholipid acyltransferase family protein [Corallincola platygyrae]|uniref:Lysophospholipid acyltransferase family protein n=1 Tax=Corallincola platygyrae TaxID=1193278 RepID=A0ABW4XJ14_9GAMM